MVLYGFVNIGKKIFQRKKYINRVILFLLLHIRLNEEKSPNTHVFFKTFLTQEFSPVVSLRYFVF